MIEAKENTNKSSLFSLTQECEELMAFGYTAEDYDTFCQTLEPIITAINEKADGYCAVISRFNGQVEMIKTEIERLTARKTAIENAVKRMKDALLYSMQVTERPEVKTDLHTIKVKNVGGKQAVEITGDVPKEYLKTVIEEKPDKDKIRESLEKGLKLDFAVLKERGKRLDIK